MWTNKQNRLKLTSLFQLLLCYETDLIDSTASMLWNWPHCFNCLYVMKLTSLFQLPLCYETDLIVSTASMLWNWPHCFNCLYVMKLTSLFQLPLCYETDLIVSTASMLYSINKSSHPPRPSLFQTFVLIQFY